MEHYNVIVVGAGIIGSWTAYILASRGVKVLLLEQFPLPHSRGSSHGQSRGIRYAYVNPEETALVQAGYPYWEKLQQEAGEQILLPCNYLVVSGPKNYNKLNAKQKNIEAIDAQGCVRLSAQDLTRRFPCFTFPSDYEAVFDLKAAVVRPDKSLNTLHKVFCQNGGKLVDGYKLHSISTGPPVRVTGNNGVYSADSLVICAGPWTNDVLTHLDLKLPLQPHAVIAPYFKLKDGYSFPNITYANDGNETTGCEHFYSMPPVDYPNLIKVGPHLGIIAHPDERDTVDTRGLVKVTSDHVRKFWPCLDPEPVIIEKCYYTLTPDEQFILDRHPRHNHIIIACGFSGDGFKISPGVGEILSDLAMDRTPTLSHKSFLIGRFPGASSKL